ncbi:hypothetical protein C0Q70_16876 [Pomacea canaliculata]|uniref:Replication protein A C-terminal domain-containing protein n=1 Tax=Pomacea canaliculata TaxID=400727 RepID=A0A2T7NR06_POMCA|nr:replication protein A 32 kDa subunit-B-like isoform X2 [Pomacea canaliculata]PVD23604.1 hypothetical protein C0Q70_16876 [Pomacea canaliculata]
MWSDQGGFHQGGGFDGPGGFSSPGGFGSQQQSDERKGRSRAQNLVPCTVAQILNASQNNDDFFSGNLQISQVTLVGLIRSVKESPTRVEYEIDDMTGPPLEVRQFVDTDENGQEEQRAPALRENTYVRVYGHVRSFAGKRNVTAFKITPVEDMNELTCHILEVLYSKAQSSNSVPDTRPHNTSAVVGNRNINDYSSNSYGLSGLHQQIANVIKNSSSQMGASIKEVAENLKGVPEKAIREAIEFLSSEGHIYSTVDDDHFKTTDG